MALIVSTFDTQAEAEQALLRLRDAGIEEEEAVLIANTRTTPDAAEARAAAAAEQRASAAAAADGRAAAPGARPDDDAEGPAGPEDAAVVTTSEQEAESTVNTAALGGAVGLFVGGGLMGPLGLALGAVAGTGVALAAVLVSRGLSKEEAQRYEGDVLAGRYLVAVETDRRSPEEVRALLEESGAGRVQVEA
jgi:hypothetical protein